MSHIAYNLMLYLIGFLVLVSSRRFSVHVCNLLAFVIVIALWSVLSLLALLARLPIRLFTVVPLCACIICVVYCLGRRMKPESKSKVRLHVAFFFGYVSLFVLANILVINSNRPILTPDSFSYSGMGLTIAESGTFPSPGLDVKSVVKFTHCGNIMVPLLWAGATFFGVDFYFSVFPLAALLFLPILGLFFFKTSNLPGLGRKSRYLLAVLCAMLLGSVPSYWHHAYYVSSGTLTAVFFGTCMWGIWIYRKQGGIHWLVMASLCQICAVLLRTEMLNFSVIPIVMLMGSTRINRLGYIMFLAPFLFVCFLWQGYKIYYGGLGEVGQHEPAIVQLGTLFMFGMTYLVMHFQWPRRKVAPLASRLLVCFLLFYLIFALYYNHSGTIRSVAGLLKALSYPRGWCEGGPWGWIWLSMAVLCVVNASFVKSRSFVFWGQAVLIYLLMRIILYSLDFLFPNAAINQFNSGNRMLIHVLPLGIAGMAYILESSLVCSMRGQSCVARKKSVSRCNEY